MIAYQENGELKYREPTNEELNLAVKSIVSWHHDAPMRVAIPIEVKKDWLLKRQEHEYLGNYPEIAALLDYVKSLTVLTVDDGINFYIYLEEVYPEHEYILNKYGATVERR